MPIQVTIDDKEQWLFPKADWKTMKLQGNSISVDADFYIKTSKI